MDQEAVVLADNNGVIQLWSPGAERLFGHAAGTAIGQTLDLIVPPEFREAHWAGFRRAMKAGTAASEGRPGPFPALHANGEVIPRDGRLTLVRRPNGEIAAAVVVFG